MRRLLPLLLVAACSDPPRNEGAQDAGGADAPALEDAGATGADAAPADLGGGAADAEPGPRDVGVEVDAGVPPPSIDQALDCGREASAGLLRQGDDLQRVDLDLARFPAARCNDGTAAVFYFRPAANDLDRHRWVIQLQGGGSCRAPDDCARRWCSAGTNFGRTQMSARSAPEGGIVGDGLMERRPTFNNPLAGYNQVFLRYCSSDSWSSRTGRLEVEAPHPRTQAPTRFAVSFHGADILDAVLSTLRRDGAAPPPYTLDGSGGELPDLDDAQTVLLAGASAGGNGVTYNADRVGELLRASSTRCGVDGCMLEYRAIIDSSFGPRNADLDWSTSVLCQTLGACTWEQVLANATSLWASEPEVSCEAWHAAQSPATAYLCKDGDHLLTHHLATPMFVRMGLLDQLVSGNAIESGVSVAGRGPMTLELFAEIVRAQLLALPDPTDREEGPRPMAPATFGPACPKHETLSANPDLFRVTVPYQGVPLGMMEALTRWRGGEAPLAAVNAPDDTPVCN